MSAAVIVCLDRNKLVEQEDGPPVTYFYEIEAVECVKAWRENAEWTDGIYAIQYRGREVSDKTADALKRMGVRILTMDLPDIRRRFMEVVYALSVAESGKAVSEDRILYSDLDVIVKKPPPADFLNPGKVILYHYPVKNVKLERESSEFVFRLNRCAQLGIHCHNTYFQAFDRCGTFQQTVFDSAKSVEYEHFFKKNVYYKPKDDDYFFEEGAYDYVCFTRGHEFDVIDMECPGDFFDHVHAHWRIFKK